MQVQHIAACLCAVTTLVGCTSTTDRASYKDGATVDYNVGICETPTACLPGHPAFACTAASG